MNFIINWNLAMARSRNIKPAFFSNDVLAELDPIDRLAFIGLWTIVDFKGCVEFRPKKIKALILPYDNCDMEKILINLDNSGFIRTYIIEGEKYLKVTNFEKHQNPHKNEKDKGSDIPDYIDSKGLEGDSRFISINPDKDGTNPADSLILIPDSPILSEKGTNVPRAKFKNPELHEIQNYFLEKGLDIQKSQIEADKFFNHYEANGWKVGKNKMKNWKAAINGWITRSKDYENTKNNGNEEINFSSTGWSEGINIPEI